MKDGNKNSRHWNTFKYVTDENTNPESRTSKQAMILFLGFLLISIFALRELGGFAVIQKVTSENGRPFEMDFRPSPALPYTFWSALIAGPCMGLYRSVCCQHVAQRYLSVKTTRQALFTALIGQVLTLVTLVWLIFIGLAMFTFYADCDPFTLGIVQKFDQMVPYFIMDLFQSIPGFIGILTSAIFSAAISSVSSGINALSLMFHKEVLHLIGKDLTPKQELTVAKILAGVVGILTLLVTFLAQYLGGIMDALLTWQGIFLGPILGAYVLGVFFTRVNTVNCLIGMILGLALSVTLKIGNMLQPRNISVLPPLSIEGCSATTQIPVTEYANGTSSFDETPSGLNFSIRQISTFYYGAICTYTTIIVGLTMSLITKPTDSAVIDKRLIWRPAWPRWCRIISDYDETDVEDDKDYRFDKSYRPVNSVDLQDCREQINA
ncbi:Sodium/iodide cotransporter [Holothuria leucospilota]|uniref:Sodium/iodide cotransporter n=1 Tax=Holothuria leucospilota TaxID=206669 RepID=A0A9Q1CQG6_HOLLE|nr:Sodium/iodide cotransporter [Holothuria leucospilota]